MCDLTNLLTVRDKTSRILWDLNNTVQRRLHQHKEIQVAGAVQASLHKIKLSQLCMFFWNLFSVLCIVRTIPFIHWFWFLICSVSISFTFRLCWWWYFFSHILGFCSISLF